MKYIILAIVVAIVGITNSNVVIAHPQYTMTPDAYTQYIKQNSWWAWVDGTQKLAFCVGMDINHKPVCSIVPDAYVVIELINPSL